MKKSVPFAFIIALAIGGTAFAHSYKLGDIGIGHIWMRATPPGATTAAIYLPLLNKGKTQDKLTGASSTLAKKIELHDSMKEDKMTKMEPLDSIALEPGKPVSLRPGGMHLMVIGLRQPLKAGDWFPFTLRFEKAGSIDVKAMVEAAGAMGGGN